MLPKNRLLNSRAPDSNVFLCEKDVHATWRLHCEKLEKTEIKVCFNKCGLYSEKKKKQRYHINAFSLQQFHLFKSIFLDMCDPGKPCGV